MFLAVSRGPGGFNKLKVVKRLNSELATDPAFLKMFLDEAKLLARLNHPNIVQANEVGFEGGEYFIEMEYLEGQPYEHLLRRTASTGGLPLGTHLFVLSQVLAGLHYAHELTDHDGTPLDVVHRDVSPHNVFITYDGAVKLLDFGIAKAIGASSVTRTGTIKGKLTYMPPEQAAHGQIDRRTDIFPVGVMLWQALTGKRLWAGLSDLQVLARLHDGDIARARSVNPAVSAVFDEICARAMAPRREDRYATAEKMQDDLEASLERPGERVESKALAKLLSEVFAEPRLRVKREIEKHLAQGEEGAPPGPVPALRVDGYGRASSSAIEDVATMAESASAPPTAIPSASGGPGPIDARRASAPPPSTSLPAPRRPRPMGRRVVGAALLAALLVAGAAGRWAVRGPTTLVTTQAATPLCTRAADCRSWAPRGLCSERGTCFAAPECVTNQECLDAHAGAPFRCRESDGRCVDLRLHGCQPHAELADYGREDTAFFGVMLSASGPGAARGTAEARTLELARRDFAKATRDAKAALRPLALLSCDDAYDAAGVARYLAEEVRVSAVVGFGPSDEALDLARSEFIPHHVLAVVADGASPVATATSGGAPPLLWRTAPNPVATAPAVSAVVTYVEEGTRTGRAGLARGEALRVALVRRGTRSGDAYAAAIYSSLSFNGKSAVENDSNFLEVAFGEPAGGDAQPSYDRVIREVIELHPHVVVLFGGGELGSVILPAVERGWPAATARPTYVAAGALGDSQLLTFVAQDPRRARRVLGVEASSVFVAGGSPATRDGEAYSTNLAPGYEAAAAAPAAYDAFYLLAYAAAAAGPATPLAGEDLARGIARLLPPGPRIDVGPLPIETALDQLRGDGGIDLHLAQGSLDLSAASEASPVSVVITCAAADHAGHGMVEVDSGLSYAAPARAVRGVSRCRR